MSVATGLLEAFVPPKPPQGWLTPIGISVEHLIPVSFSSLKVNDRIVARKCPRGIFNDFSKVHAGWWNGTYPVVEIVVQAANGRDYFRALADMDAPWIKTPFAWDEDSAQKYRFWNRQSMKRDFGGWTLVFDQPGLPGMLFGTSRKNLGTTTG